MKVTRNPKAKCRKFMGRVEQVVAFEGGILVGPWSLYYYLRATLKYTTSSNCFGLQHEHKLVILTLLVVEYTDCAFRIV